MMVLFESSNEVCSVVGGPAATQLLFGSQKSLQARLADRYPVLVQKERHGPAEARSRRGMPQTSSGKFGRP